MADRPKDSFALRLLHTLDRLVAPSDKPALPKTELGGFKRIIDQNERNVALSPEDDITAQVANLRRKRKIFSMGSSDEPRQ